MLTLYLYVTNYNSTVPKTNTSKQVEYTKAFEWTIIKELGKMTTVTSG